MNVKEGDLVEYSVQGETFHARVDAVLWVGSLKARIIPAVKGHPNIVPIKFLNKIEESNP